MAIIGTQRRRRGGAARPSVQDQDDAGVCEALCAAGAIGWAGALCSRHPPSIRQAMVSTAAQYVRSCMMNPPSSRQPSYARPVPAGTVPIARWSLRKNILPEGNIAIGGVADWPVAAFTQRRGVENNPVTAMGLAKHALSRQIEAAQRQMVGHQQHA